MGCRWELRIGDNGVIEWFFISRLASIAIPQGPLAVPSLPLELVARCCPNHDSDERIAKGDIDEDGAVDDQGNDLVGHMSVGLFIHTYVCVCVFLLRIYECMCARQMCRSSARSWPRPRAFWRKTCVSSLSQT